MINSKLQIPKSKQILMPKTQTLKQYDLEDRTLEFAKTIRNFVERVPKSAANIEYTKQLIRSSGSIGANYIEANEALSKKDFLLRAKICRKEAKESRFWLRLIDIGKDEKQEKERLTLQGEVTELLKIFSSIINKSL